MMQAEIKKLEEIIFGRHIVFNNEGLEHRFEKHKEVVFNKSHCSWFKSYVILLVPCCVPQELGFTFTHKTVYVPKKLAEKILVLGYLP